MNQEQAQSFTTKMLQAFGGYLVTQDTLRGISIDLLKVDLTFMLPFNGLTLGPLVYLKSGMDPWTQVLCVTQQCQYLAQLASHPMEWLWFYATEPEMRTKYIAEAMRAELELEFVHSRILPSQDQVRAHFEHGYQLKPQDVEFGVLLLERAVTAAKSGVVSTQAGRIAIQILGTAGLL